jgi:hypothetical protein
MILRGTLAVAGTKLMENPTNGYGKIKGLLSGNFHGNAGVIERIEVAKLPRQLNFNAKNLELVRIGNSIAIFYAQPIPPLCPFLLFKTHLYRCLCHNCFILNQNARYEQPAPGLQKTCQN